MFAITETPSMNICLALVPEIISAEMLKPKKTGPPDNEEDNFLLQSNLLGNYSHSPLSAR